MNSEVEDTPFPEDVVAHVNTPVADQGLFGGEEPNEDRINQIIQGLAEGKSAKDELAVLKPVLAFALSKLPKKQLRVRAEEMDTLADTYLMQSKSDGNGGVILRSVKVL